MTKMFTYNGKRMVTWNLFTGCNFNCSYCWARKLAETRLKASYPNGFIPTFHPERLKVKFQPDDFVFVCSMGDISFAEDDDFSKIIGTIEDNPQAKFLIQTKDPSMFIGYDFPPNVYTGVTLETNRLIPFSKAPSTHWRVLDMAMNHHVNKFVSIEPIMDFDLVEFSQWIYDIRPEIIEIGADNYHNNLPEPQPYYLKEFLGIIKRYTPVVIEKQGLERLLK